MAARIVTGVLGSWLERLAAARWLRRAVAVLVVLDLVGGAAVLVVRAADSATPVAVTDAVAGFREATADPEPAGDASPGTTSPTVSTGSDGTGSADGDVTAPAAPAATAPPTTAGRSGSAGPAHALPATGLYVYATEGEEEVDVLGGTTHRYPAETTITVTATDCGFRTRWDALEERWDEHDLCLTSAGIELVGQRTYHEFFGQSDRQTFSCEAGSFRLPAAVSVGTAWTTTCRSGATPSTGRSEVVELTPLVVDGQEVEAVHVRSTGQTEGSNRGSNRSDDWYDAGTGLLLRRISHVETESDSPFGTVNYREDYRIELVSLDPQR